MDESEKRICRFKKELLSTLINEGHTEQINFATWFINKMQISDERCAKKVINIEAVFITRMCA